MTSFRALVVTTICSSALLAAPIAQALQINDFNTLTKKQIESSYFFNWNHNSVFRVSLIKAFNTSKITIPTWLRKGGGPAAPAQLIVKDSTRYVLLNTCKFHQCDDNNVYILFNPATKNTTVAATLDKKVIWAGKGTPITKQILISASGLR